MSTLFPYAVFEIYDSPLIRSKYGITHNNSAIIIAMDTDNRAHLVSMARTPEQRAKIHLLREFDPQGGKNAPVPDPYYGGIDGFERTYEIVERSVQGLFAALEAGEV